MLRRLASLAPSIKPILLVAVVGYALNALQEMMVEFGAAAVEQSQTIAKRAAELESLTANVALLTGAVTEKEAELVALRRRCHRYSVEEERSSQQEVPVAGPQSYEFQFTSVEGLAQEAQD